MDVASLYEMFLEAYGFNVIGKAKNGAEAVEMYKKFEIKPDIIIMDYRMPIMNGIEATREILQINHDAKIIFASADTSIKEIVSTLGVLSFKVKPFDNQKLLRNIKKALKRKEYHLIESE